MRKKVLSLVLTFCMVLSLLPTMAFAAESTKTSVEEYTTLFKSVEIDGVEIGKSDWSSLWNIFQSYKVTVTSYQDIALNVTQVEGAQLKYGVGNTKYPGGKGAKVDPNADAYKDFKSTFNDVKSSLNEATCYLWILATKDSVSELIIR